ASTTPLQALELSFGGNLIATSVVGGTVAEIAGGDFANGAATAAFAQLYVSASQYYEQQTGYPADWRPGENRSYTTYTAEKNGQQPPETFGMNVVGNNDLISPCRQGSSCSRFFNSIFGNNAIAGFHDHIFNKPGHVQKTPFTNIATMPYAASITYGALIGNSLRGWQDNPLSWYLISQDGERKRDKSRE
ncbi:MAG: hypothetical protein ACREXT_00980, partial [Gammaproteobacteria bacterium]